MKGKESDIRQMENPAIEWSPANYAPERRGGFGALAVRHGV